MSLRLALVGGPMYDRLYEEFDRRDVEVVVHEDHPTLNRVVAQMLADGQRIDVLSTHSKYAPSQAQWLQDLGGLVATDALAAKAVELCRVDGAQRCVPRNIDVRVLWANESMIDSVEVPTTWPGLAESGLSFAFPGRESGLFGTLFEIVVALGGALFDDRTPTFDTPIVHEALACLATIARHAPVDLPTWHYDQVDAALGEGRVQLGAAWPGGTAAVRTSKAGSSLRPYPYFGTGSAPRSYAGCHAWAIPTTCGDFGAAVDFVQWLASESIQSADAANGTVCAHDAAFAAVEPVDAIDARRLDITRATVRDGMLTYPPMANFPAIEDAAWSAIHEMLVHHLDPVETANAMQRTAEEALR